MRNSGKAQRLRVIVLGYIVRGPLGGLAWHHLQYVLGLSRLGHDVWFIEHGDEWESCYDPSRDAMTADPSYGLRFTDDAFDRLGMAGRWAYYDRVNARWHGPAAGDVNDVFDTADLVINVSGVNDLNGWGCQVPRRVYIDTDPVFTQVRNANDADARSRTSHHNVFLTFAENVGQPSCSVPDDGFPWTPTRQPVVLECWEYKPGDPHGPFTTVMQWDSYAPVRFDGVEYGMKSKSFEPYEQLPARVDATLELALGSESAPRDRLRDYGWRLVDPRGPTRDPWRYQAYLAESAGEFGVAKHGYVASWSGWFSERSANYLASGRPVVVQDTGFSHWLEAEHGVVAFSTPDEAAAGIMDVLADYEQHTRQAREVAAAYFSSEAVLKQVIEHAFDGVGHTSPGSPNGPANHVRE